MPVVQIALPNLIVHQWTLNGVLHAFVLMGLPCTRHYRQLVTSALDWPRALNVHAQWLRSVAVLNQLHALPNKKVQMFNSWIWFLICSEKCIFVGKKIWFRNSLFQIYFILFLFFNCLIQIINVLHFFKI